MDKSYTAFAGARQIAHGTLGEVTSAARTYYEAGAAHLLILDDATGKPADLDLRERLTKVQPAAPARGRPRLGVIAREITLLPSHWDWLSEQPGGASATLRRLVDQARRAAPDVAEQGRTALYRAMLALAGDLPSYEEANRALFAGDLDALEGLVRAWPDDVRAYLQDRIASLRAATN